MDFLSLDVEKFLATFNFLIPDNGTLIFCSWVHIMMLSCRFYLVSGLKPTEHLYIIHSDQNFARILTVLMNLLI